MYLCPCTSGAPSCKHCCGWPPCGKHRAAPIGVLTCTKVEWCAVTRLCVCTYKCKAISLMDDHYLHCVLILATVWSGLVDMEHGLASLVALAEQQQER